MAPLKGGCDVGHYGVSGICRADESTSSGGGRRNATESPKDGNPHTRVEVRRTQPLLRAMLRSDVASGAAFEVAGRIRRLLYNRRSEAMWRVVVLPTSPQLPLSRTAEVRVEEWGVGCGRVAASGTGGACVGGGAALVSPRWVVGAW